MIQLATFEQYKKKNGDKAWKFKTYLGIDPKTGKQIQTTRRGFRTQKEAKIALAKLQTEFGAKKSNEEKPKTYKDVYLSWMKEYEKTVAGSTLLKTKRIFTNHILQELGDQYISEITPLEMQNIMNQWSKEFTTANKMMNYVGLVFKYAIRFGYIENNPVNSIMKPRPKKNAKKTEFFYDKTNLKLFLNALDQLPNIKSQAFFRLLSMTGMRKQEAAALFWKDIDLKRKTININKAVTRTAAGLEIDKTKTVGSTRIISVDEGTINKLLEWKQVQQPATDEQLIFSNHNGGPKSIMSLDTPRKWLLATQDEMDRMAGKKIPRITTHGFRHTHVSLLVEMGATLKQIQDRLGHDDIQTTMDTYAHVSKTAREQLADQFNSFIDF
ncbi:site-specific integrase [Enterococcus sp. E5-209]|nr:site-specific integrase [Enterococcus faecium]MEB4755052.1 site-specific integrase [Enterococcus sp. E5-209]